MREKRRNSATELNNKKYKIAEFAPADDNSLFGFFDTKNILNIRLEPIKIASKEKALAEIDKEITDYVNSLALSDYFMPSSEHLQKLAVVEPENLHDLIEQIINETFVDYLKESISDFNMEGDEEDRTKLLKSFDSLLEDIHTVAEKKEKKLKAMKDHRLEIVNELEILKKAEEPQPESEKGVKPL